MEAPTLRRGNQNFSFLFFLFDMRIAFTGGGSGGHLYPIIAVAREVKRIAEEERLLGLELYYFGPDAIGADVAAAEELISARVSAGKFRRYVSFLNFFDAVKIAFGIGEAFWKMLLVMPDVVFCKGGFGSFPVTLASRLYRIPVVVHESDSIPGLVNRWAGRWARRVAISFAGAAKYFPPARTALIGVPVRNRIIGGNRESAREVFGVFSNRPVLFVTGGSQGADILNRTLLEVLKPLAEEFEVIHSAGPKNIAEVRLETAPILEGGGAPYYHPFGLMSEDEMRGAFSLADIVVSRAGATAIYEVAANAKPAILIPLKIAAQDHQKANAYEYAGRGAAIVIEEDNLTPSVLFHEIKKLNADTARRARMAEAARSFARPEAAAILARELLTLGLH